jgi:hypothetical protein
MKTKILGFAAQATRILTFIASVGSCLFLIASSSAVYAATIFSDFGPPQNPYNCCAGYGVIGANTWYGPGGPGSFMVATAMSFTSSRAVEVTEINIALKYSETIGTSNSVIVSLLTGDLSTTLASWSAVIPAPFSTDGPP